MKVIKLIYTFYKGLVDSTAVIKYGRDVKNREKNTLIYAKVSASKGMFYLPKILFKEVIKKKVKKINFSFSEIAYAGHTKNNLREFDTFHNWCEGIILDSDKANEINNIANVDSIGYFKRKDKSIVINFIFSSVVFFTFLTKKIELNPTSLTYALDYTRNFLTYFRSVREQKGCLPSLLVVSNDHNPNYVAISRVFKLFGVKRVYLQHAAVSSIFPKLDFEFAVLTNENSRQTYNKIGKSKAITFTISRSEEPIRIVEQEYNKDDKINVCLLPTSIPSVNNLNLIIESLEKNPKVNKVYIKHHPRFSDVKLIDSSALVIDSLNEIKNHRLICIAGNTTAALDYALLGEEVYQCFAMDEIPEDYYGFVKKSVCKHVQIDELAEVFWPLKFKAPKDKLKEYCPHLAGTHEYSLLQFKDAITNEMNKSIRANKQALVDKSTLFEKNNSDVFTALNSMSHDDRRIVINAMLKSKAISHDEHLILTHLLNNKL